MQLTLSASELTRNLIDKIYVHLEQKGWNLTRLSIESGVPYDTIKKYLSYKIDNPHFYNILKICYALDMNLGELMDQIPPSRESATILSGSEYSHTKHIIEYITQLEESLAICSTYTQKDYIPILRPLGIRHQDSLSLDSYSQKVLDVGPYRARYGNKLVCGIEITTNTYHPVYMEHDIILIGKDRPPVYGETGVFIHDGQLFLRRYLPGNPIRLEPLNELGPTIELTSLEGWFIFGYVLSVYR